MFALASLDTPMKQTAVHIVARAHIMSLTPPERQVWVDAIDLLEVIIHG
jgi:hypothetical protein